MRIKSARFVFSNFNIFALDFGFKMPFGALDRQYFALLNKGRLHCIKTNKMADKKTLKTAFKSVFFYFLRKGKAIII